MRAISRPFALCFLLLLAACAPGPESPGYAELEIEALQRLMAQGELTSEQLTAYYLDRIETIDRDGPALNSIIEVNPQALDIARALDRERATSGARIGVIRNYRGAGNDARVDAILDQSVEQLRSLGAEIVDAIQIDTAGMGDAAQAKGPLTDAAYLEALETSKRIARQGIDGALTLHGLDALIAPTRGPAWLTDHVNGDQSSGISSSSYAVVSGYPGITVPAGFVAGLPIGLSFIGEPWSDVRLVRYAYAFEQASRVRRPPPIH